MDVSLGQRSNISKEVNIVSLNPYCSGCVSMADGETIYRKVFLGLNPYCSG